ncbi:MAG: response regulator transcription factor [Verrucomicrobia bacterium]|nr:response regulator transcription factor [Verrucomicrobiota bacterium]
MGKLQDCCYTLVPGPRSDLATNSPVTVAVVEDNARFSDGLVSAVQAARQLRYVGLCQTFAEALTRLPEWPPDVVLLDLDLGNGDNGLDLLPTLVRQLPDTRFLVLTVVDDPEAILQALRRGAFGYLRKSTSLAELPAAILEAHQGCPRLSPEVLRLVLDTFENPPATAAEWEKLSPREAELLELLAQGYERKELALLFKISAETVKTHIRNIHHKLRVVTTQQAVEKVFPGKRLRLLPRWVRGGQPV